MEKGIRKKSRSILSITVKEIIEYTFCLHPFTCPLFQLSLWPSAFQRNISLHCATGLAFWKFSKIFFSAFSVSFAKLSKNSMLFSQFQLIINLEANSLANYFQILTLCWLNLILDFPKQGIFSLFVHKFCSAKQSPPKWKQSLLDLYLIIVGPEYLSFRC